MKKKKEAKIVCPEFCKRSWLNSISNGGGTAFIKTSVGEVRDNQGYIGVDGSVDIADCSRIVTLDFYTGGSVVEQRALFGKIDKLMMALGEFRGKIQKAIDASVESHKNYKKHEKKKLQEK